MPKYDYRCSGCGMVYEKRESFSAPVVQPCPTCKAEARRVLTPPAIVFKGSGWYKTDSRGGASTSTSTAASSGTGSSESGSDTTAAPSGDSSPKSEAAATS